MTPYGGQLCGLYSLFLSLHGFQGMHWNHQAEFQVLFPLTNHSEFVLISLMLYLSWSLIKPPLKAIFSIEINMGDHNRTNTLSRNFWLPTSVNIKVQWLSIFNNVCYQSPNHAFCKRCHLAFFKKNLQIHCVVLHLRLLSLGSVDGFPTSSCLPLSLSSELALQQPQNKIFSFKFYTFSLTVMWSPVYCNCMS